MSGHIIIGIAGGTLGLLGFGCLALTLWNAARKCRCRHDDPAGWVPGMDEPPPSAPPLQLGPYPPAAGTAPVPRPGAVYQTGRARPLAIHDSTLVMPRVREPRAPRSRQ